MALEQGTRGHRFKLLVPCCNTDIRQRSFNVHCISVCGMNCLAELLSRVHW